MKFKKLLLLVIVSIFGLMSFYSVKADMGPHPTSLITITDIQEPYHFDLLVDEGHRLKTLSNDEIEQQIEYNYYDETIPSVLNGFQDSDGYVSYTLYSYIPHVITQMDDNPNQYRIGYFSAPDSFKIILVLNDDTILISKLVNKKCFDAHFTYDLSGVDWNSLESGKVYEDVGELHEVIPVFEMSVELVISIIITIAIELFVLFLFGYRDNKSFKLVFLVNLFTQTVLSVFVVITGHFWIPLFGTFVVIFFGEILVFIIEIIAFALLLKEKSKSTAVGYAIAANLVSAIVGFFAWELLFLIYVN